MTGRFHPLAVAGILVAVLVTLCANAQQPPAAVVDQRPQIRSGVNTVRVNVTVLDKDGHPLDTLSQDDFEILEEGERQKIESFKLVRVPDGTDRREPPRPIRTVDDEERETARDDLRIVGIFLDIYHLRRIHVMAVREKVMRFVRDELGPNDLVALMDPFSPLGDGAARFTRDHDAVARALERLEGRKFEHDRYNEFDRKYELCTASQIERARTDVTLSALQALVARMGSFGGSRKSILLFSEGFTFNPVLPKIAFDFADGNAKAPGCNKGPIPPMPDVLREMTAAAARANTVIYAFDPRSSGMEFFINENVERVQENQAFRTTRETLETLAIDTDGHVIVKPDDLNLGLARITRDSQWYYLITYNSTAESDNKFHKITVRVNKRGSAVGDVRARKGYWAYKTPTPTMSPAPAAVVPAGVSTALNALSQPVGGRFLRTWAGVARGVGGRPRVSFVWEPAAGAGDVRVSLQARSQTAALYQGRVEPAPPSPVGRAVFDADPGQIQLVVTAARPDGEVLDRQTLTIRVPEFSAGPAMLSTPQLIRASTQPEWERIARTADALPTAVREFRRQERVLVRFELYGASSATPTARVLDRRGAAVSALSVAPSAAAAQTYDVQVPIASLAPGDYVIELAASDGSNPQTTEWIAFRIRN